MRDGDEVCDLLRPGLRRRGLDRLGRRARSPGRWERLLVPPQAATVEPEEQRRAEEEEEHAADGEARYRAGGDGRRSCGVAGGWDAAWRALPIGAVVTPRGVAGRGGGRRLLRWG